MNIDTLIGNTVNIISFKDQGYTAQGTLSKQYGTYSVNSLNFTKQDIDGEIVDYGEGFEIYLTK